MTIYPHPESCPDTMFIMVGCCQGDVTASNPILWYITDKSPLDKTSRGEIFSVPNAEHWEEQRCTSGY